MKLNLLSAFYSKLVVIVVLLLNCHVSFAQQSNTITGHVTDASGNKLSSVTVNVKGKNSSTQTDKNGSFSINADVGDVLVFTSVGYQKREEKVNNIAAINVSLSTESKSLNPFVVTEPSAYGSAGTISDADAQAYLDAHPYNDARGLEMINTQFWAATFFNEYEAWSNYRRTGYPVLVPVNYPGSQSPNAIPRRMAYSTVDKQVNSANYNAAVAGLQGGDKITSRVWWDVP